MNSNDPRPQSRRQGRGGRRNNRNNSGARDQRGERNSRPAQEPKKLTFWQKLISFFTGGSAKKAGSAKPKTGHVSRPPERVEVTSPKLYVGNLSYRVSDSDLYDLFKGVGDVQNAEVATDRETDRSKGFGFVTMDSVDEARRAAEKLHDKDFMGRRLVVSGSKSESRRDF